MKLGCGRVCGRIGLFVVEYLLIKWNKSCREFFDGVLKSGGCFFCCCYCIVEGVYYIGVWI